MSTTTAQPAPAQHPGPCARLAGKACRRCELAETNPAYQRHWRESAARATGLVRRCIPCAGNVRIKNATPDLLPGLQDPLPVAELPTIPPGWPQRPDVRAKHIKALRWLATAEIPPPARAEGDGIVTCGGGPYWPQIVVSVRMLRDVSALPVQVWYRGAAEPIDPQDLADVPGVTFHDSTAIATRKSGGWEQKLIALVHCGLQRVLYLDADAYVVRDPAPLLALACAERPLVFWQDLPGRDRDIKWEMVGIDRATGQKIPSVQGGQIALHRAAFWRGLLIAHWLNQHSDYFYQAGFGDQSQWSIALAVTG